MDLKYSLLFKKRFVKLEKRIKDSCIQVGVEESNIKVLAVSKKKTVEAIRVAISHGLKNFGESYVSEALEKINNLNLPIKNQGVEWHFIGAIQKNKTKMIAENFDWVHSVDRFEIAKRLSDQRPLDMKPLRVFLQINIDNEENKKGISSEDALDLAIMTSKLPNLIIHGLMAIPMASKVFEDQKKSFSRLKKLKNTINESEEIDRKFESLSMGMSGDLEAAISETETGTTTWLRIGTSIFGERN